MRIFHFLVRASLIALLLNLAACGGGSSKRSTAAADDAPVETPADNTPDTPAEESVVRMILLGDSGSGSEGAYAVGKAVAKVCAAKGCDLVLGLGDNIYESGVSSALDPQFEEKFELPFAPIDLPFYFVLGNHDNSGFFGGDGANNAKGDFEVDYHYRDSQHPDSPRQTSRWKMPSRYYRFTQGGEASAPLVELFGVDSNQIAGGFPDSDENYSYNNYGLVQAQWLNAAMADSKAKWKIVFAHHPYISNGSHGNAGNYDGAPAFVAPVLAGERYKAFVEETVCDKADFFFAGHDHDLQWLMPVASCGKTGFILSGAASKTRSLEHRDDNPVFYEKGDSYGFVWVEIKGDKMVGEVYQVDPTDPALGLGSLSQPEPAFRREQSQQAAQGLPESDGFTSPLQGNTTFDVNGETGNLDPVQTQFSSGFNSLAAAIPEENISRLVAGVGESGTALLEVADSLITGLQGAATEQNPDLALAGAARASQSLLYALQSLQDSLISADGQALPAPLDQLSAVLEQFSAESPSADDENASADLRGLTDPLRSLASNIQNIVDGIAEEGGSVPVAGASLDLLSELLFDVTRLIDATGNVDSGEMAQVLVSTTDDLLANILLNVVPIEEYAPSEVSDAIGLGPKFLGTALLLVSEEVAYHLDTQVLQPLLAGLGTLPLSALDDVFAAFTL
ncbi:MAG: metallophosphoesterase [Zhongshania sp.]|uniref:metallophosphoesterase n=1 Tax=Zhongshania sp. TaxID=1971902 RepID=UPI002625BB21|nr:metallophosphoesterase [Zhongshania sp.]MDF1693693.1 metallophosphoesterase [Zhongshania sp.]